jgi:hypothetical protein
VSARSVALAAALAAWSAPLVVASGCASSPQPDGNTRTTTILAPPQASFQQSVSPVLERRCATLDCHGQIGRPLRLYSARGLRLGNDAGLMPGIGATTSEETTANYRAVIGLEPEEMTRVLAGVATPRDLLLLKKPLMLEGHKGGPAIAPSNDPAELCIVSWLLSDATHPVDQASCTKAATPY